MSSAQENVNLKKIIHVLQVYYETLSENLKDLITGARIRCFIPIYGV